MDCSKLLSELESLGTEQNRKIFMRHGVKGNLYGVSFANLEKLRKQIKKNQLLAQQLWESANHDGRILALMIADPKLVDETTIDKWIEETDSHPLVCQLASFVSKTNFAEEKMIKCINVDNEYVECSGWNILSHLSTSDNTLKDEFFEKYLPIIENQIHSSKNHVKAAMNNTLIAIGSRNESLQAKALVVAAKIGKVVVDHGETNCKTPDASGYMKKALAHRQNKALKAKK